MLKIGDKIEIKKKPSTYEDTFNGICEALRSDRLSEKDKLEWSESALNVLELWYNQDEMSSVKVAKKKLIPILHNLVSKGSINSMALFFDYYKKVYALCARRDFECFVDYMEWDQPKKVLANRREVLKPYVEALQELAFNPKLHYVVVCYPPSIGKSYIATLWEAWAFGMSIDNSFIRMSYSDELVLGFSRTVKGYLQSPNFCEVFTQYAIYNGKPFEVERESDWKIKNANVPKSKLILQ